MICECGLKWLPLPGETKCLSCQLDPLERNAQKRKAMWRRKAGLSTNPKTLAFHRWKDAHPEAWRAYKRELTARQRAA